MKPTLAPVGLLLLAAVFQNLGCLSFLSMLDREFCTAFSPIESKPLAHRNNYVYSYPRGGANRVVHVVFAKEQQQHQQQQHQPPSIRPRSCRGRSFFPLCARSGRGVRISANANATETDIDTDIDIDTDTDIDIETDTDTDIQFGGTSNDLNTVRLLTSIAIYQCGTDEGLDALRALFELCERRLSFDFDADRKVTRHDDNDAGDGDDGGGDDDDKASTEATALDRGERVISRLPGFLPDRTVGDFLALVRTLEDKGWMSTNPDSVDGLPSLHVNLVSRGKPLFDRNEILTGGSNDRRETDDDEEEEESFERRVFELYDLIRPHVYERLLPTVDGLLRENDRNRNRNRNRDTGRRLRVSDVFFRRYGQDVCGNVTRNGISIHYDVFSRVTAVIALDEVASGGDNGLFTLAVDDERNCNGSGSGSGNGNGNGNNGATSNHKALRRFFPLRTGDCVVHTWDVLHGVDVEPGLDRTSLIVWFDEVEAAAKDGDEAGDDEKDNDDNGTAPVSPWLSLEQSTDSDPSSEASTTATTTLEDGNDVRQFVLASALSSVRAGGGGGGGDSSSINSSDDTALDETRLYLKSAARGNVFALARMGSICEEGGLSSDSAPVSELKDEALRILEDLRPFEELPEILRELLLQNNEDGVAATEPPTAATAMACRFWLEAALSGNPLAQKSLADEIMFEASVSGNPDQRLLAAVLFALASQQETGGPSRSESESDSDALSRVIEFDLSARDVRSQEDFLASPVVQTARAAFGGF